MHSYSRVEFTVGRQPALPQVVSRTRHWIVVHTVYKPLSELLRDELSYLQVVQLDLSLDVVLLSQRA